MATEFVLLGWSVALLLIHIAVQGAISNRDRGPRFNVGPRDGDAPPLGVLAGRAERALRNYGETWPAFAMLALGLAVAGRTGGLGETGAVLWFAGRVAYLPLYLLGIPYLRSAAWTVAMVGIVLMLVRFL